VIGTILASLTLTATARVSTDWIWGVTLDTVDNPSGIVTALSTLPARATARVVFDPGTTPADYKAALTSIHAVANVMGEPVDSEPHNSSLTVEQYRQRMATFMDGLKGVVDIWEIGNEVNGEWTGNSRTMAAKISAGYAEAKKRGLKTSLTLYYQDSDWGTLRDMAAWGRLYLPADVRGGVDYVFVSFYPTTATGTHPNWAKHFGRLVSLFPRAKFGFGELGLAKADGSLSEDTNGKAALIRRYYGMSAFPTSRFVGGYFWWTFQEDALGATGLWSTFRDAIVSRGGA